MGCTSVNTNIIIQFIILGSSMVEHLTVNQRVAGSSPARGAISEKFTCLTKEIKQKVKQERVFSRCVISSLAINKDEQRIAVGSYPRALKLPVMHLWRNGRRASLRNQWLRPCWFNSSQMHHNLLQHNRLVPTTYNRQMLVRIQTGGPN